MAPSPVETCVLSRSWFKSTGTVFFSGGSRKVWVNFTLAHLCYLAGIFYVKISRSVDLCYSEAIFSVEKYMFEDLVWLNLSPPPLHHLRTFVPDELASSVCGAPHLIRRQNQEPRDSRRPTPPCHVLTIFVSTDLCHNYSLCFSGESDGADKAVVSSRIYLICSGETSLSTTFSYCHGIDDLCLRSISAKLFRSIMFQRNWAAPDEPTNMLIQAWPIKSVKESSPLSPFVLISPAFEPILKGIRVWPIKSNDSVDRKFMVIRLVDYDSTFMCWGPWPTRVLELVNEITSLPKPILLENNVHLIFVAWICLVSLKISNGFIGVYNLSVVKVFSVGSPYVFSVSSSFSTEESLLQPSLFFVKRVVFSDLLPNYCFSLLVGLSSCVAVCIEPEDAIENTSVFFIGEDWLSTSLYVTILQLSDFVVKYLLTHSSFVSNSLSLSHEDLSVLILSAVVLYAFSQRGCKIPSCIVLQHG